MILTNPKMMPAGPNVAQIFVAADCALHREDESIEEWSRSACLLLEHRYSFKNPPYFVIHHGLPIHVF